MSIAELKNKKIVIVGLGINNAHLARYLKDRGVFFETVEHWNSLEELEQRLVGFDVVFRTPGLPFLSQPIQNALQAGAEIYSQTKLFFDLCLGPIIGVTGTKGKGTTSTLIAEIIKAGNKKAWLAGNVGKDPFEFLDKIEENDWVVLELSSFQLQDLHKSPHIAVVLNIDLDHVDESKTKSQAVHYSFQEYVNAKAQIFKHQTREDYAIIGPDVPKEFGSIGEGKKIFTKLSDVSDYETRLLGEHNLVNIAAAREVARLAGVDEETIRQTVKEFSPLPYRLQNLGEVQGVSIINDGYSTNPGAVTAAIKSFTTPIVLIVGGYDKGFDFSDVGDLIKQSSHIKAVVAIGDQTEKIVKHLAGFKGSIKQGAKNMDEIVSQAMSLAEQGDTVLFSPGTSSFDMFNNETDRAEKFTQAAGRI